MLPLRTWTNTSECGFNLNVDANILQATYRPKWNSRLAKGANLVNQTQMTINNYIRAS